MLGSRHNTVCGWAGWLESYRIVYPVDRLYCDVAHGFSTCIHKGLQVKDCQYCHSRSGTWCQ